MRALRAIGAAWSLLTIVPIPGALGRRLGPEDWSRSAAAFPLVGLVLAALLAVFGHVAVDALGATAGAALTVAASAILTAGLHLDGLADACDALGARGSGDDQRQRRLEIMRDSGTGTYGTLALIFALLLQTTALATLAIAGGAAFALALLIALPLGRTAGIVHAAQLQPARSSGLGASFAAPPAALLVAGVLTVVLWGGAAAVWVADQDVLDAIDAPIMAVTGALLALGATTRLARAKLGGRTGDTIGATIVVAETLALLGFLALV